LSLSLLLHLGGCGKRVLRFWGAASLSGNYALDLWLGERFEEVGDVTVRLKGHRLTILSSRSSYGRMMYCSNKKVESTFDSRVSIAKLKSDACRTDALARFGAVCIEKFKRSVAGLDAFMLDQPIHSRRQTIIFHQHQRFGSDDYIKAQPLYGSWTH
jgi:hypothetical protein